LRDGGVILCDFTFSSSSYLLTDNVVWNWCHVSARIYVETNAVLFGTFLKKNTKWNWKVNLKILKDFTIYTFGGVFIANI